jgi:hypothetical protein
MTPNSRTPDILKQLHRHARMLRARLAARALVEGLALGAVAVVVLAAPVAWLGLPVTAALLPGLLLAAAWAGWRTAIARISLQDAALELEARLEHPDSSLSALLGLPGDSRFYAPVGRRAEQALNAADRRPGRALLPTSLLVSAPVLVLAAGTLLVWVGPPQADTTTTATATPSPATPLDIGGGRSAEDERAVQEAMGLQEQAMALRQAAAALREPDTDAESALRQAEQAASGAAQEEATEMIDRIRRTDATDTEALEELSDELAALAAELEGRAARALAETGRAGTRDTGTDADFDTATEAPNFVPFPRPAETVQLAPDSRALASQTPARRRLAQRATEYLEHSE